MSHSARKNQPQPWSWWPLALLLTVHFVFRWLLVDTPHLAQADYDESITGLMALHLLKGDWQIFFWGQPYMGTLEPTLAGILFWLAGPSTKILHLDMILISSLGLITLYALGREAGDNILGLLAAAYWAMPPVFLTFDGLYATGGHLEAVVAAAFFLSACCRLAFRPPESPRLWACAAGFVAGLGWWCSLLVAPLLLACGLGLVVAKPRLFKTAIPWLVLLGFALGSAPFWWWNLNHDWMTFQAIEHGSRDILGNLLYLGRGVWLSTLLGAWWDGHTVETMMPGAAKFALVATIYLPVLLLAVGLAALWLYRLAKRQAPLQHPMDLVVAVLLAGMLAHSASSYGHSSVTRYAESLYVALAVLTAYWLYLVYQWRKPAMAVLLAGLMIYNGVTHVLFVKQTQASAIRPVDEIIAKLRDLGMDRCYAHGRLAYPITFESRESIIAADHSGWRNYDYLREVDQAAKVAIVTHDILGGPFPGDLKLGLRMLGGGYQRDKVGDYVVWYGFRPPPPASPLDCRQWRVRASDGQEGLEARLCDRDLASAWPGPKQAGDWLEIDLGRQVNLSRLSLLPRPGTALSRGDGVPLRLEVSLDGQAWQTVADGRALAGLVWLGEHPKLSDSTVLEFSWTPKAARYLRVVFNGVDDKHPAWALAEIFAYESSDAPGYQPPASAVKSYQEAEALLEAWTREPKGPHPNFPGVPLAYRAQRVDWPAAVGRLKSASLAAPQWEQPLRRMLEALLISEKCANEAWTAWPALPQAQVAMPLPPQAPAQGAPAASAGVAVD